MPPKKQLTKEQIIIKAYDMVRSEGYDSLTARKLAKELNCSTQPIYQAFSDMKELKLVLIKKAQEEMLEYIMKHIDKTLPLELSYILAYVLFSVDEKYLFHLIFTSGGLNLNSFSEQDMELIKIDFNMLIYANGIVMMLAFKAFDYSEETVRGMLIHAYESFRRNEAKQD